MNDIGCNIILQRKIGTLMGVYIMLIIVIMLLLIMFLILFHYKTYYTVKGTIVLDNDNYYVQVYVPLKNNMDVVDNDTVIIDNVTYKYSILDVSDEYFTDNYETYQIIRLKVNLKDNLRYNNLMVDLKIFTNDKRIIDYFIKGGEDERT